MVKWPGRRRRRVLLASPRPPARSRLRRVSRIVPSRSPATSRRSSTAQCAPCHQPGRSRTFSLITYDEVRQHAAQIADVTAQPVHAAVEAGTGIRRLRRRAPSVRCPDRDDRALGRRRPSRGRRASDLPSAPRLNAGWQLGAPDLVVTLPEYTLRADGADVFRNFVVTVPGRRHALRPRPGIPARAGAACTTPTFASIATPASRRLDEADPEPGYEGMILHSADYPDGHFLGWTPGQAPPLAPNDLAWRLDAGDDLVVQLHLQPTGKPERIRPSIGLYFADQPPVARRRPSCGSGGRTSTSLPATRDYRVTDAYVLPVDAEIRAIQPHAHYRARSVTRMGGAAGRRAPAADRHPPLGLQLAGPVPLRDRPSGCRRARRSRWSTCSTIRTRTCGIPSHPPERVSWGWRSSDEMADVWIQVMTRDAIGPRAPRRRRRTQDGGRGCDRLRDV